MQQPTYPLFQQPHCSPVSPLNPRMVMPVKASLGSQKNLKGVKRNPPAAQSAGDIHNAGESGMQQQ